MKSDFHVHSAFSGDCTAPMETIIRQAIALGLDTICFTEHYDEDYPEGDDNFSLDTSSYYQKLCALKDQYHSDLDILFGIELGMQSHLGALYTKYIQAYPFDFVIASQHLLHHADPYYPSFWEGRTPSAVIRSYFEETLQNLKWMSEYDTLAHMDYIIRYAGSNFTTYSYEDYADVIDPILTHLIENGKCLEINTAGLKYGLPYPNPCTSILARYRELGGELITIGSDAHKPEHLAYAFHQLPDLLTSLGFHYYCIFRKRKAEFLKID